MFFDFIKNRYIVDLIKERFLKEILIIIDILCVVV